MPEIEIVAEGANKVHCSNCGAELAYKPGTSHLVCEYCQTENFIEDSIEEIEERDLLSILKEQAVKVGTDELEVLECQSCGAINELDEKDAGQDCDFCGGHLLLKDASRREQLKPQGIIPFKIDSNKALTMYSSWINSLWWAPNKLKRMQNQPKDIKGIYIPYWTFDAQTESDYTGQRGEVSYYEDSDGNRKSRTDWYSASGHVSHFFDDHLVLGSKSVDEVRARKLDPWNFKEMRPFDPDYLRGFKVESYSVNLENAFVIGKDEITGRIRSLVKRDIGGDKQRIHELDTEWSDLTFKHILLPIYLSAYRYNDKTYKFLINGQTGEVQGSRPYSFWKIFFAVLGALLVIGAIIFFSN